MKKCCLVLALAAALAVTLTAAAPAAEPVVHVSVYRPSLFGPALTYPAYGYPAPLYAQPAYAPAPAVLFVPQYAPAYRPYGYYGHAYSAYYPALPAPVAPPPADGTLPPPLPPADGDLTAEVARLTRLLQQQNASPEAKVKRLEKRVQALEKVRPVKPGIEVVPGGD